jgi:hypothetical protein
MEDRIKISGNYYFGGLRNASFLLMAAALYIWASPLFMTQQNTLIKTFLVGFAAMLIGLLVRFTRYGYEFDFTKMKFREYLSVLGVETGSWVSMEKLSSLVISTKDRSVLKTPGIVAPANASDEPVYVIALYAGNMPRIIIPLENKEEAIKLSHVLAERLNLEIRQS